MSNPKKLIDFEPESDQSQRSELVNYYSADKQLLQQAVKDLEQRIFCKTQQLAADHDLLKQLLDKFHDLDKPTD